MWGILSVTWRRKNVVLNVESKEAKHFLGNNFHLASGTIPYYHMQFVLTMWLCSNLACPVPQSFWASHIFPYSSNLYFAHSKGNSKMHYWLISALVSPYPSPAGCTICWKFHMYSSTELSLCKIDSDFSKQKSNFFIFFQSSYSMLLTYLNFYQLECLAPFLVHAWFQFFALVEDFV